MRTLKELAARAAVDNRRAEVLRRTIQIVGDHHSSDHLKLEITFAKNVSAYEEAEEVVATIKRLWPKIWEDALSAAKAELDEIESRYAPLLNEHGPDGDGCA